MVSVDVPHVIGNFMTWSGLTSGNFMTWSGLTSEAGNLTLSLCMNYQPTDKRVREKRVRVQSPLRFSVYKEHLK